MWVCKLVACLIGMTWQGPAHFACVPLEPVTIAGDPAEELRTLEPRLIAEGRVHHPKGDIGVLGQCKRASES